MLRTWPVGGWWVVARSWLVGRGWLAVAGLVVAALVVIAASQAFGQTPQPFPRQGGQPPQAPRTPAAPPAPAPSALRPAVPAAVPAGTPSAATLVFPVYPSAQFLASYDAGRAQRYYIFGTTAPFADIVLYYKNQLKEGGDTVFKEPPTHMFNVGRFREETMAFPPGVTVKDWTWGGSQGYPNPILNAQPPRFPTIIMIVPPPATPPAAR